jgi:hypothetical protein
MVKGPRGSLSRTFKHLAVDIQMDGKKKIKVIKWFGKRKELAAVNTVCSHIQNMFKGVTKVVMSIYNMRLFLDCLNTLCTEMSFLWWHIFVHIRQDY